MINVKIKLRKANTEDKKVPCSAALLKTGTANSRCVDKVKTGVNAFFWKCGKRKTCISKKKQYKAFFVVLPATCRFCGLKILERKHDFYPIVGN